MVPSHRTFTRPSTFRKLLNSVFTHIISLALPFVARLAKVCISPAKPLGNTTTKFTFELYKIFAVLRTILHWYLAASWTDQFFGFEVSTCILCLIHGRDAIFSSTKVRLLTLKAHEVSINNACILFGLAVIGRLFILELLICFL